MKEIQRIENTIDSLQCMCPKKKDNNNNTKCE